MQIKVPKDDYWLGHWRWGPAMLAPITALVILLWILTAAQISYGLNHGPGRYASEYPYIGHYERTSTLWVMLCILPVETVHLTIHNLLYLHAFRGWRLHPVAALTLSIVWLGPWVFYATMNMLNDFISCECYLNTSWLALASMRGAIASIIVILYFVYMGFAAKAVHEWRGRTARRRGVKGSLQGRMSIEDGSIEGVELPTSKR